MSLIVDFTSFILSGFLFEIGNIPTIQYITSIIPLEYFVEITSNNILQEIFMKFLFLCFYNDFNISFTFHFFKKNQKRLYDV